MKKINSRKALRGKPDIGRCEIENIAPFVNNFLLANALLSAEKILMRIKSGGFELLAGQKAEMRLAEIPQKAGLYCLYIKKQLVYVGKSTNLKQRLQAHFSKNKDFDSFCFFVGQKFYDLEDYIIYLTRPAQNKAIAFRNAFKAAQFYNKIGDFEANLKVFKKEIRWGLMYSNQCNWQSGDIRLFIEDRIEILCSFLGNGWDLGDLQKFADGEPMPAFKDLKTKTINPELLNEWLSEGVIVHKNGYLSNMQTVNDYWLGETANEVIINYNKLQDFYLSILGKYIAVGGDKKFLLKNGADYKKAAIRLKKAVNA